MIIVNQFHNNINVFKYFEHTLHGKDVNQNLFFVIVLTPINEINNEF